MSGNNLPIPLTRFIGREKEIAEVIRLSAQTRLLTLTGAGGCGKTRLALEVGARLADSYELNVAWVELAPLSDPALVPQAVAQVFDVRESTNQPLVQTLINHLRSRHCLLILDNCEHVITACAQLAQELLQVCPHLVILTTSREALNIVGETAWRVPQLEIPDPRTTTTPEALLTAESARLFVDRANSTEPTFAVNTQNANAIAQICYRLDGMPLAIELAAARIKSLPIEQIAVRLDDRFRLLNLGSRTAPPRQQTLRAVIDWSYGLLAPTEKILFRRLAIFAGSWTLETAEAICGGDGIEASDILDALTRLVDKSLVIAQNNTARYRMLETIQQYAHEKLIEANELQTMRTRHCDFFVKLGEQAEPKLKGPDAKAWMDRLESEYDNIRAVFEYALANDVQAAVRLAWSLLMLWVRRGYLDEGHKILLRLLAHPELQAANRLRLHALKTIGFLQLYIKDTLATRAYYEEGLSIAKRLEDENEIAFTLHGLGRLCTFVHDYPAARNFLEESLALYRQLGNQWGIALVLFCLGHVMDALGEHEHGHTLEEESLSTFQVIGDICDSVLPLGALGRLARNQGDYACAIAFYEECIEIEKRIGDRTHQAIAVLGLGYTVLQKGDYRRAADLYTEMFELLERRGTPALFIQWLIPMAEIIVKFGKPTASARLLGAATALHESLLAKGNASFDYSQTYERPANRVRTELGAEKFEQAWQVGYSMTLDQAIAFALNEMKSGNVADARALSLSPRQAAKAKFGGLTGREREVAALIARGKSNREIANTLVLSERTVEDYVGNILNKLGFHARTQIAAWAVQKGLEKS